MFDNNKNHREIMCWQFSTEIHSRTVSTNRSLYVSKLGKHMDTTIFQWKPLKRQHLDSIIHLWTTTTTGLRQCYISWHPDVPAETTTVCAERRRSAGVYFAQARPRESAISTVTLAEGSRTDPV